jgi:hypothetical protein
MAHFSVVGHFEIGPDARSYRRITRFNAEGSPHISSGSGADPRRNGSRYDQVLLTIEGLGARFTQRDGGDEMTQAGESGT